MRLKLRCPDRLPAILLIEDNDSDAMLVEMAFAKAPFPIWLVKVETGFKALSFLRKEGEFLDAPTPDLILMDLHLPVFDGKELLTELRSDPRLNHLPVVILSSGCPPREVEECYRLGCSAYFEKPFNFAELSEMIRVLCEYWFFCAFTPKEAADLGRGTASGGQPKNLGVRVPESAAD